MRAEKETQVDQNSIINKQKTNVTFHIYSTEGRSISNFLGLNTKLDQAAGETVLFPSGS